jgi:hypothetical protein
MPFNVPWNPAKRRRGYGNKNRHAGVISAGIHFFIVDDSGFPLRTPCYAWQARG